MLVRCLYGSACQPVRLEREMPKKQPRLEAQIEPSKITEPARQATLKLPLRPSITKDSDGFQLIVNTQRALWVEFLQPRGLRPDGRRWPVVRHELGDARTMTVDEARTAALAAKLAIKQGRDPHRERLASRASSMAQRSIVPTTTAEVAALYAQAIGARAHLSHRTRRKIIHYVNKAIRVIGAGDVALSAIDTPAIRLMLERVDSSAFERLEVFDALYKFMDWCVKHELIPANPCSSIGRDDRPRPGRSRDHTPPVATIRRAWDAAEDTPDHVRALIRFLLLNPLRREEAQGLLWSEVDFNEKRINIRAERMKGRQPHSLPLSEPALAILAERASCHGTDDRVFASPTSASSINWTHWVSRIRVALGEDKFERSRRFNLHDIRRSFVSALAERGFDVDLLDQCLSHSRKGTFAVYQRSARWREREAAVAVWAELVAPSIARHNVVSIRG
jgi:integrase